MWKVFQWRTKFKARVLKAGNYLRILFNSSRLENLRMAMLKSIIRKPFFLQKQKHWQKKWSVHFMKYIRLVLWHFKLWNRLRLKRQFDINENFFYSSVRHIKNDFFKCRHYWAILCTGYLSLKYNGPCKWIGF